MMVLHQRIAAAFLSVLPAVLACAAGAAEVRLADRVFLVRDKPGAATRFEMIVNAGSMDEAGGTVKGTAHYVEHLVLVGRNAEHKDLAIRFFADGSSNGWTNDRATVYLHNIPARKTGPAEDLAKLFGFYAARLKDFSVSEADAARERNVVLQEHDFRIQSSPSSLFYRDLTRKLMPDHPAGQWTIGTRDSIQSISLEEARAFHASWYGLNNAWFVVRGDIAPEDLKPIAEKALAEAVVRSLPTRANDTAPAITIERIDERQTSPRIARPLVSVAKLVRIPEGDRLRHRAIRTLMGAYLSSQFTGSAHDLLVEDRDLVADGVNVFVRRVGPDSFVFSINATLAVGADPVALREAMLTFMDGVPEKSVPGRDVLDRLKKRQAEARKRADELPRQVHERLVGWLADGQAYDDLARWPGVLDAVQPAEVAAYAKALAAPGRVVTGILEPEGGAR